ncbi:ABC transporter ATP-binding protein [uncultured Gemmiger sp.]|uniref:ABC transporter ATP-binding protein n=1 Tax=uncultured Gemmiger sp. TaxID=1623490 RepID=UPI0025E749F6|nr:ABC transporter ATP-binding protein [uncultured Gemmiger sp.]
MPASAATPILQVHDLCKVYGAGPNTVAALDHVSLTVQRGEFVSIVGPSGSGKSTLLHILGGVDRPTSGRVTVDGVELSTLNETRLAVFRRRQIGLVYQFYNLIPVLTVAENLTLPLLLDHRRPDAGQVKALADELGIAGRLDALPGQLSGGQQQRVSIGRALLTRPALVLADEPTGNLDRKNSAAIVELLKKFHAKYSQTLILITHDPEIALQAGRILSLEDGRIVKDEVVRP